MSGGKETFIRFINSREKESMLEALKKLSQMSDKEIAELTKLMPHQVMDVKDVLRRSGL